MMNIEWWIMNNFGVPRVAAHFDKCCAHHGALPMPISPIISTWAGGKNKNRYTPLGYIYLSNYFTCMLRTPQQKPRRLLPPWGYCPCRWAPSFQRGRVPKTKIDIPLWGISIYQIILLACFVHRNRNRDGCSHHGVIAHADEPHHFNVGGYQKQK